MITDNINKSIYSNFCWSFFRHGLVKIGYPFWKSGIEVLSASLPGLPAPGSFTRSRPCTQKSIHAQPRLQVGKWVIGWWIEQSRNCIYIHMYSTFSDADSMLNTVFLQFTKAVVQANFKMSCKHQSVFLRPFPSAQCWLRGEGNGTCGLQSQ